MRSPIHATFGGVRGAPGHSPVAGDIGGTSTLWPAGLHLQPAELNAVNEERSALAGALGRNVRVELERAPRSANP